MLCFAQSNELFSPRFNHVTLIVTANDYTPTSPVSLSLLAAKSHPLAPISSASTAAPVIPHERPSHVLKDEPRDTASVQCNKIDKADDNEEDTEEFVDAVEEMSTPISAQTIQLEDQLQTFSIDSSVPLKRSNSNFSLFSLPPNAIWDPSIGETVSGDPMTKSLTVRTLGQLSTLSALLCFAQLSSALPCNNLICFFLVR
jgi:hypothetical protein